MTEKEMLAEIERLRNENQKLNARLDETKVKAARPAFPDELLEHYPSLKGILWDNNRVRKGHTRYAMLGPCGNEISRLVRYTLFYDQAKGQKTKLRNDTRVISVRDLDDVQYEQYLEAVRAVFDTLDEQLLKTRYKAAEQA